ncbi:hypothetical protein B0H21DRAFT_776303 [Amylocystis lapponica]|nr:hypothetical protein B0H21DRAFT_776303 [Amylocystis lapponica]
MGDGWDWDGMIEGGGIADIVLGGGILVVATVGPTDDRASGTADVWRARGFATGLKTVLPFSPHLCESCHFLASLPRHSRIRFPAEEGRASPEDGVDDSLYSSSLLGLGPPPIPRRSTAGHGKGPAVHHRDDGRRRVKSVDVPLSSGNGQTYAQRFGERGGMSSKRISTSKRNSRRERGLSTVFPDDAPGDSHSLTFSDEYDLYPRILEDVQRAIKLKARREARLRASQSMSAPKDSLSISDVISAHSSPLRPAMQIPPPIVPPEQLPLESEVDFSPSIGTIPLHPVPASADNGATLDWTGSASEDEKSEKRWPLSLSKRKLKDRYSLPSSRTVVEKQDSLYADKLSLIKNKVKPPTLRKAAMTSDQLSRQYGLLLAAPNSNLPPVNLLSVARWYDKQEPTVKAAMDKVEPLTWLKHLQGERGKRTSRPPWFLSALIVEEYVKAHLNPQMMATIPEDEVALGTSPALASFPEPKSPSSGSTSWTPPHQFLEPSISRKRSSYDAQVSFEPFVESGRDSVGADSRANGEGRTRYWRNSLPNGTDSGRSSMYMFNGVSPNSSRLHLRDFARRMRRRQNGSDDALSSARNSISEHSASEDGHVKLAKTDSRPASARLLSPSLSDTDDGRDSLSPRSSERRARAQSSSESRPIVAENLAELSSDHPTPKLASSVEKQTPPPPPRLFPQRRIRISLPSSIHTLVQEQDKRQREVDDEKERQEYEHKTQLLDDTVSQNYRIRHLLQRVGANIREYDVVQSNISAELGMPYPKIPPDVLDAFAHDPSAVTSTTRNLVGWRAVEDIHHRINQQRDTLRTFASTLASERELPTTPRNVFDDAVTSLSQSLKQLELCRQSTRTRGGRVMEALTFVKEIHAAVKNEYKDTLSHTSLVYPEISQIVALEESWRNQYQQFWDIGLDALTFLLDTVTPFWRNYGKVIGEDIQDFLIIPWYRNEFTGEPKRYPIKCFPKRSFRHWVGLLFLSFLSICVTTLQTRALSPQP